MGTTTVTVETEYGIEGSFEASYLESLGFSISASIGGTYYARTSLEHDFVYSVY